MPWEGRQKPNMAVRNNNNELSNSFLPLTEQERSVIMGTLLGDGHLQKRGKNSYRLKISHGLAQKAYVLWKHNKLKRLCTTTQAPKESKDVFFFYSSSGKYLEEFHELFYHPEEYVDKNKQKRIRYVKRVTQKLLDSLPMNPLVLAVLYMDDGSVRNDAYSSKLAVQGFPLKEIKLLVQYLEKWGVIEVSTPKHTENSGQYYIGILAKPEGFSKFIDIIGPIVKEVPGMGYKLNESRKPRND